MLAHNYDQTLALSLLEMDAVGRARAARPVHGRPGAARASWTARSRACPTPPASPSAPQAGKGLTRPELAVLLAYGKLELKREIVATDAPDDPFFEAAAGGLFPQGRCASTTTPMRRHRLRREIIATVVANEMVNRCGPTFPARLMAAAGCDAAAFTAGYEAAKAVLGIDGAVGRGRRARRQDPGRRPDGAVPAAGRRPARRDLLAGPPRGARAAGRRRADRAATARASDACASCCPTSCRRSSRQPVARARRPAGRGRRAGRPWPTPSRCCSR